MVWQVFVQVFYADSMGPVGRRRLNRSRPNTTAIALAIPVDIHGMILRSAGGGLEGGELRATVPALWAWLIVVVCDPMILA